MHLGDISLGMVPALAIVGASATLAPGLGLAFQMQKSDRISVCVFGDGASNEGGFHEGLNFAAVNKLALVLVAENNGYAYSTPTSKQMAVDWMVEKAASYGVAGE